MWVTLHISWKAVFSYDQQFVSNNDWIFCERSLITPYYWQLVSDIAHFLKDSLITSFPMTTSLWVTSHILWKAGSSHLFLWSTASEWCCTFCERWSHHFFYDQQGVSELAHFLKGSLITSFPMTNSKWVTLHILWNAVSSHLFLWPTASEQWHCTFCERQFHHIFSYNQQQVSDIAHFVKVSLITSFPMTNSEWVTFHICETEFHFLWPTGSKWLHCTFWQGNLITSFLWPTVCEQH